MICFAITSNHPRHMKFLETLYERVEIPLVVVIDKGHITQEEADYFSSDLSLLHRTNILRCSKHQLHSNFVLQSLAKLDPKVGFVFGAPLLKKEIFELPEYGCVNIPHTHTHTPARANAHARARELAHAHARAHAHVHTTTHTHT